MTERKKPNLRGIAALIGNARPVAQRQSLDPDPGQPRSAVLPGEWAPNELGLPPDCPVKPLGVSGNVCWFLDTIGQLQALSPPYARGHILALFMGREKYLYWAWPKFVKATNSIESWRPEKVAEALVGACADKGPWNATEKVRGRGAWRSADGGLILHTGRSVFLPLPRTEQARAPHLRLAPEPPGDIGGWVYPTRPEIPGPWPQPIEGSENLAKLLLQLLKAWRWARPEIDPLLLIGWLGAAMIGGALDWRPAVFITGDKATGKSTLQDLIKRLLGDALIQAVDTSAAGIYQRLGHDSLPVAVDEMESESDTRKARAVLKLARAAASGGLMLRGGDRHEGVEFQARSCFLFSSINAPPLEPQDLSRMALLRLSPLPKGQVRPEYPDLEVIGRMILRRMLDGWTRLPEVLAAYKAELAAGGMDGRGQATFGTLLACADIVLHDAWDEERLLVAPEDHGDLVPLRELMRPALMPEFEDAIENWRLCLNHLLSTPVEVWRGGGRANVGRMLDAFWREQQEDGMAFGDARKQLELAGLGLIKDPGHHAHNAAACWLAVPNQAPLVAMLYQATKWGGEPGSGVWAPALRQGPRARDPCNPEPGELWKAGQHRINGVVARCTLISLNGLYGEPGGIMTTCAPTELELSNTEGPDLS